MPVSLDKYQYYSPNALSSKGGESEKIIIGGRATCRNVFGFYFSLNKDKYHLCLTEEVWSEDKQDNIKDTTEVVILNIDEFPTAKEIYDLSDKLNFNLYRHPTAICIDTVRAVDAYEVQKPKKERIKMK